MIARKAAALVMGDGLRRSMTTSAAALALLFSGCATAPVEENDGMQDAYLGPTMPLIANPQIAASSLLGLTPNQVRERFGLNPVETETISVARLEGESVVTVIDLNRGGGGCTNQGSARLENPDGRSETADFIFRDGRFAEAWADRWRGGSSRLSAVVVRCYRGSGSRGELDPLTFLIVLPYLPFLAGQEATDEAGRKAAAASLADLRLGEPPPGGLAVYARTPPRQVTVTLTSDGDAEIAIKVHETNYEASASVRDGRVVALVAPPYGPCILGADRALHCS